MTITIKISEIKLGWGRPVMSYIPAAPSPALAQFSSISIVKSA